MTAPAAPATDVLVIGGGATGLAAAIALREGAAAPRVVVCEAGHVGYGPQRHAPGLVLPDLLDPWGRVARGMGDAACRALHDFAATGPAWLRARLGAEAGRDTEVRYLPTTDTEWEDLRRTAALFASWGVPHTLMDERPPAMDGPLDFDAAALVRRDVLWASRPLLAARLAGLARAAGVDLREGCPVGALRTDGDGVVADTQAGPVRAAVALVACEGAAGDLVPALAEAVRPWRGQGLRAHGLTLPTPVLCNYGHEMYLPHDLGGLGTELEVAGLNPSPGEADCTLEAVPTDRFQGFLQSFCELRLGARTGVRYSRPWAAPTAFTPDGLPLVGALPGRPEILVAAGFHGRGLAWGVAAGVALAARLRGGADTVPPALDPRRLVG